MMYEQNTVRNLYKKLLTFYPREFQEQLGESMEQTFNDLCNERRQTSQGLFSFVLWTFIETAIGIVQERILLIREMNLMNNMLANLRSSAIIGFFIILPFVVLELTVVIIKGLTFDSRDALDSIVLFGILWIGVVAILLILMPIVRNLRAGNRIIENPISTQGNAKRNLLNNPLSAMIIGIALTLPFLTLLSQLMLGIEPSLGPLDYLLKNENPDGPHVLGTLIVLGAFLLSILGSVIIHRPIVRTIQAGGQSACPSSQSDICHCYFGFYYEVGRWSYGGSISLLAWDAKLRLESLDQ